jgi:hypothetical protein
VFSYNNLLFENGGVMDSILRSKLKLQVGDDGWLHDQSIEAINEDNVIQFPGASFAIAA